MKPVKITVQVGDDDEAVIDLTMDDSETPGGISALALASYLKIVLATNDDHAPN